MALQWHCLKHWTNYLMANYLMANIILLKGILFVYIGCLVNFLTEDPYSCTVHKGLNYM